MTTNKYDLETIAYSTQGWNGILTTVIEKLDSFLHTRLLVTLGEAVAQYETGYIKRPDGKAYKALANQSKQPALGLFVEAGNADEGVRLQRIGPVTNAAWSWAPGKPVYLSPAVLGGLTQVPPSAGKQLMGIAQSATTLVLTGTIDIEALATTTTTTTTTSSTTTTTSSSTTTTTTTTTSSTTTTTTA